MEMNEIIGKALEQAMVEAVEQKVAEKMQEVEAKKNLETLQEKIDFVKGLNRDELFSILNYLNDNSVTFNEWVYGHYVRKEDRFDDLSVSDVADAGLLEDCFERYVEDNDEREIIKDLVDRL